MRGECEIQLCAGFRNLFVVLVGIFNIQNASSHPPLSPLLQERGRG
jgi:hypothetical protein